MKNTTSSSPVGIRIPKDIKRKFNEYCDKRGLRKSYLLSKIIEEKLLELEEDEKEKIN
jgi:predicted DNA-binding protein